MRNRLARATVAAASVLLVGALSSCGDGSGASPITSGPGASTPLPGRDVEVPEIEVDSDVEVPETEPDADTEVPEPGTTEDPDTSDGGSDEGSESSGDVVPRGETGEGGGWSITITEVEADATDAVNEANPFPEAPTHDYALISFTGSYDGDSKDASPILFEWTLLGGDGVRYEADDTMLTPSDLEGELVWKVKPGEAFDSQFVIDAPAEAIEGGTVRLETFDDKTFEQVLIGTFEL